MANPLLKIFSNPAVQARVLRMQVTLMGLAMDFWKDTPFPVKEKKVKSSKNEKQKQEDASAENQNKVDPNMPKPWFADKIQIMEQLWGDGNVIPGDEEYLDSLIVPLGLSKEMSVLDLSAGVGGLARKLATESSIYVTALEPDKVLASRGMVMSIAAGKSKQAAVDCYDPTEFEADKKYDCVFVRDLFYRVVDKDKFFNSVAGALKPKGGQLVFTDYVLEEKDKENPAIKEWLASEKDLSPLGYIPMVKEWKGLGFDMRVAEDQTDDYKKTVMYALAAFSTFLKTHQPSPETKPLIVKEVNMWAMRLAAIENGLRYCRFYGIKK